ncbi:MAG: 16S rRNA pseudouridine516 synthase [Oleispira sp.]|jgi:16S rRNA pseudouridine516 synthase
MQTKSFRIDRYLSKKLTINRRDVKLMLAQGRIVINGDVVREIVTIVEEFDHVVLDGELLQDKKAVYIMMNKPIGVVSATKDDVHKTVIDLLPKNGLMNDVNLNMKVDHDLHIVGRLDLNTSGLLLLTNDSRWSRKIMSPEAKVKKVYRVTLANNVTEETIAAFAKGMYFPFENITTLPASLTVLTNNMAEVVLMEGKYHQVKRMFGRFRNPVLALHRSSVGNLVLDESLAAGESRALRSDEVNAIFND